MATLKYKVVVCGGGIGGLTFALTMAMCPTVEVEIYEATKGFSATGAGIGIWPRVWKILSRLGLDDLASKASSQPSNDPAHAITLRKSDQPEGYNFYDIFSQGSLLTFHRHDFQEGLVKHLPPSCQIHYSKRLLSYNRQSSGKLNLTFQDGSTTTCDILIGADGIKSTVRKIFLHDQAKKAMSNGFTNEARDLLASIDPFWSGTIAYRALIPIEALATFPNLKMPSHPVQYVGKNGALIIYPVRGDRVANLVAYQMHYELADTPYDGPWVAEATKNELVTPFSHWEPEVRNWLQCVENPKKWAIHTSRPLASLASDGVILLGDAAHAMTAHQGSGAGQAIEDAYFLATLLGHPSAKLETIPHIFDIYNALRRPFADDIARNSLRFGQLFSLNDKEFNIDACDAAEQKERLIQMGDVILKGWEWAWATSLDGMMEEGIRMLEKSAS